MYAYRKCQKKHLFLLETPQKRGGLITLRTGPQLIDFILLTPLGRHNKKSVFFSGRSTKRVGVNPPRPLNKKPFPPINGENSAQKLIK